MALPFYITMEQPRRDFGEIADAVFKTFESIGEVRIPRQHMGAGPWGRGAYGSTAWYVAQAFDQRRGQVDLGRLWALFDAEPWQERRHFELGIFTSDLFAAGTNFVFGETRRKINGDGRFFADTTSTGEPYVTGSLQSAHRISGNTQSLFGLLLHELGHFYGLSTVSNPRLSRGSGGLLGGHCDDRSCIMEQVNMPGRLGLDQKVAVVNERNPRWFCDYDFDAVQENLRRLYR